MKNKYGAIKTNVDGIKFDSKAESKMYQTLQMLERTKVIKDLKLQPEFELQPAFRGADGKHVRAIKYRADFSFYDNEKKRFRVLDCKGFTRGKYFKTDIYKVKEKLFNFIMKDEGVKIEYEI